MKNKMSVCVVERTSHEYSEIEHKVQVISMQHSNCDSKEGARDSWGKKVVLLEGCTTTYMQRNQIQVFLVFSSSLFSLDKQRQCYYSTYHYKAMLLEW